MQTPMTTSLKTSDGSSGRIKVVVQRCHSADLLLDNDSQWEHMDFGLIVYVSFTQLCEVDDIARCARHVANLPVCTLSHWGDGNKPESIRKLVEKKEHIGLMIIPQAGLVSKIKGKSLQYRNQSSKVKGLELYILFCKELLQAVIDQDGGGTSMKKASEKAGATIVPDVPPSEFFRQHFSTVYSDFDLVTGLPTMLVDGNTPVSKSKRKKLIKQRNAYSKRHTKWLDNPEQFQAGEIAETKDQNIGTSTSVSSGTTCSSAIPDHFTFIQGKFGNRQGLKIDASCGPFTHSFTFS
jgi:hypothetical protein